MSKLIIDNRSMLSMTEAMGYCRKIVEGGRVSETSKGKQYCFHTCFQNGVHVSAFKNDKSDRLVVHHNDGIVHKTTKEEDTTE